MSKSLSSKTSRLASVGIATGVVVALILAAPSPASAASAPLTLSSLTGASTGTNTITASSTALAAYLTGVTAPVAYFSMPTCQTVNNTTASTGVTPSTLLIGNVLAPVINKVSNLKATVQIPVLTIAPAGAATTKYNLCIYSSSGATAPLIGSASYTVAVAPVFAAYTFPASDVAPVRGPALGGSLITVTATSGLPTAAGSISATLGGIALTGITPVGPTSFTAVTPAHAPGLVNLNVTTSAGTQSLIGAYTYANGITISPNTAPNTGPVYVDVAGAGFLNDVFGTAATKARVWLVRGQYDPGATADPTGVYLNGPSAECTLPVVISDSELICKIDLLGGFLVPASAASAGTGVLGTVPSDTYTLTVVSNSDANASDVTGYLPTELSSGSTFTVAPY
jgi:hypothetical protein